MSCGLRQQCRFPEYIRSNIKGGSMFAFLTWLRLGKTNKTLKQQHAERMEADHYNSPALEAQRQYFNKPNTTGVFRDGKPV